MRCATTRPRSIPSASPHQRSAASSSPRAAVTTASIHDGSGRLKPLAPVERKVYDDVSASINGPLQVFKNLYSGIRSFQDNLADGQPNQWRCRAGARYLYICEDGLVHYCSQQRGYPAVPLETYTVDDIRREFATPKPCAPYCTVGCVHRVSTMDFWRAPQDARLKSATQTADS